MNQVNFNKLLNIGVGLSAQRDITKLLSTIVAEAMSITNCDAGTIYLYEEDKLQFKIMRNLSLCIDKGGEGEPVGLPSVAINEENICAYVVIHRRMENIPDVYSSEKFDFSGPRQYDSITGYRTRSMMVIPLENNKGAVVGVLQLINAMDEQGKVIPFDFEFEAIFRSVASQAAIAVTNMKYTQDIKKLFQSFVEVFTMAVDERTHYNANHTRNVARLTEEFLDFINEENRAKRTEVCFDDEQREQIIMAAWLHDVGKIITPPEVMDKASKLGSNTEILSLRFDKVYYVEKDNYLEGGYTKQEWDKLEVEIREAKALCLKMNTSIVTDDEVSAMRALAGRKTVNCGAGCSPAGSQGEIISWLTPQDVEELSVRYGTLTEAERKVMEEHVVITEKLLSKIEFTKEYKEVPLLAASHHEKLNGSGYPHGFSAKDLNMGTRVLSLMDIYEALTAKDRPYKKPMTTPEAFTVLEKMEEAGEIDAQLLALLKKQHSKELEKISRE